MKEKWVLLICIIGLIVFTGLMVSEFVFISKTVEVIKKTLENDTLLNRLKKENIRVASADIANQIVAKLPDNIHFRLLAIGPIDGESDDLNEALTASIKSKTRYHLIERKDLKQLLEEQGIQLSPIADARRPIEPGRIKGVEGLILGKVEIKYASFTGCNLEAFIKLDDVEGGDVVFAETFYAHHIPKHTIHGGIAIIFLILLVFCVKGLKNRKIKKAGRVVERDSSALVGLEDELKKAKDLVNQAHDRLVQKNMMPLSVRIREARDDLSYLLDRIGQTPGVYRDAVDRNTKTDLAAHSQSMMGLVKNVLAESEKLLKIVKSSSETEVNTAVESLLMEVNRARARFQERPVGKS